MVLDCDDFRFSVRLAGHNHIQNEEKKAADEAEAKGNRKGKRRGKKRGK